MDAKIACQICESVMLLAFGLSWPISIYKSWSLKFVKGKSPLFLTLILVGYTAGISAKLFDAAYKHELVVWTVWLYVLNWLLVGTDILLYIKYRNNHEPITEEVAEDIAHIIENELEDDHKKSSAKSAS